MATLVTHSCQETEDLGRTLGSLLAPGDAVMLSGELGGGKTSFVRGVVEGLMPGFQSVSSPTFAIMNEYADDSRRVCHFDFYRMRGEDDILSLGFDEYLESGAVCLVEWPERMGHLTPEERLAIEFSHISENSRRISFGPHGERYEKIVQKLTAGVTCNE